MKTAEEEFFGMKKDKRRNEVLDGEQLEEEVRTSGKKKKRLLQRGTDLIDSPPSKKSTPSSKQRHTEEEEETLSENKMVVQTVQEKKSIQPSISKFFSKPSPGGSSITAATAKPGNSETATAELKPKRAPTKFGRSEKTLVKKVHAKPKVEIAESDIKHPEVIEFDDDDDAFASVPVIDLVTPDTKDTMQKKPGTSKSSQQKSPQVVKAVKVASSPVVEPMKKTPVKDKKKKTPVSLKEKTPKKSSPIKTEKAQAPSAMNDLMQVDDEPVVSEITTGEEKKNKGFRSFISRGGPVAPGSKPLPVGKPNCLKGLAFVFTGELDSTSREDAADLVKRYGGRVVSAPSSKTSYLVVGREAGESKLKKAESLNLKTLGEDEFFQLIETLPGDEGSAEPVAVQKTVEKNPTLSSVALKLEKKISHSSASPLNHQRQQLSGSVGFGKCKDSAHFTSASPANDNNSLWTVKYAPKSRSDLIGNKSNADTIAKWLNSWKQSMAAGFKGSSRKDDISNFRAILISGPPGIGKTSAAHIVARECGFQVIELNASDARNKSSIDNTVKELIGNHCITEYFKPKSAIGTAAKAPAIKNHVIVMDECDGMGGGDRGGIAELIQMIKKTKIPIICICNDRMSPKVRSLANYCLDLRFNRPTAAMTRNRIMNIARGEGLTLDDNALDQLVSSTQSDIRQILNMLQTWALCNTSMTFDQSKSLGLASKKNIDMGPFDLAGRLFSGSTFRGMSIDDKLGLYFSDYQLLPPFVQENYVKMKPWVKNDCNLPPDLQLLNDLAKASDSISLGDTVDTMVYSKQEFSLMPIHAMFSCVIPATTMIGNMGERMQFPSILGQISKTNKSWRLLKELHMHMNLHISGDKNELRQNYFPALILRTGIPLIDQGAEAIDRVIKTMDEYYMTREDFDTLFDLSLAPWSSETLLKKINTQVKSAFTRTYNKQFHHSPFAIGTDSGSKSAGTGQKAMLVDFEEAVVDETAADEDEEEGDGDDKMIKQKVQKKASASAGRTNSKTSSAKGSSSSSKAVAKKKK